MSWGGQCCPSVPLWPELSSSFQRFQCVSVGAAECPCPLSQSKELSNCQMTSGKGHWANQDGPLELLADTLQVQPPALGRWGGVGGFKDPRVELNGRLSLVHVCLHRSTPGLPCILGLP